MPDKKSVVGQNNNELWHHLCPDEEKVWCAFPPSLSHMFFFISPSPQKKNINKMWIHEMKGEKGSWWSPFFPRKKLWWIKISCLISLNQKINEQTHKESDSKGYLENIYIFLYIHDSFLSAKYIFSFLH